MKKGKRIFAWGSLLLVFLWLGGGCATVPSSSQGSASLGELRGGSEGMPTYKQTIWNHPTWGP